MEYVLYEVIRVPEWEAPAECTEDALKHLAQWDYGEYYGDYITRSEAKSIYAQHIENHDYFLVRDIAGDMTLYRKWYGEPLEK